MFQFGTSLQITFSPQIEKFSQQLLQTAISWLQNSNSLNNKAQLDRIEAALAQISTKEDKIIMDEQLVKDALNKIDAATTKIGINVQSISDAQATLTTTANTISTEVDALVAAMQAGGVDQALIDQATALSTKADALGTASDTIATATAALVPVLQGIAAKGATNPVPVPVPPPVVVPDPGPVA